MANKDTIVADLVFNTLTQEQFDNADTAGSLNAYELYATPDNSLKGNLFDFKWTDHKLNDISWLNADTFSWQSGDVYVASYEHLASEVHIENLYAWEEEEGRNVYTKSATPSVGDSVYRKNGDLYGTVQSVGADNITVDGGIFPRKSEGDILGTNAGTDTVGGITITFYRAEDGHKICLPDQEANVQALYEATGVAWYYILDTANKQFKLPRTKFGFTGLRDTVGGYVEAGLPNITGTIGTGYGTASSIPWASHAGTGALYAIQASSSSWLQGASSSTQNGLSKYGFDASRSNATYGKSKTVQPRATQMYLYFYVGNFEQSALEQTAGITSEQLNNKADVELVNSINSILSTIGSRVSTLESDVRIIGFQLPLSGNAYTFYIKFSNGFVVQGRNTVAAAGVWNLPVPMQDANYVVATSYVTSESSNTPQWKYLGVAKTSTTVTPAQNGIAQSILVLGKAA